MLHEGMAKKIKHPAQAKYQAAKEADGAYIQVNVKWKTADDVKMFKRLRERFAHSSDSHIVRIAVKELAAKRGRNTS